MMLLDGDWRCNNCDRVNEDYIDTCWGCGITRTEDQKDNDDPQS